MLVKKDSSKENKDVCSRERLYRNRCEKDCIEIDVRKIV